MKQSFWREMALVSAPFLVIAGVFGWIGWQKRRFRTPTIALSVRVTQSPLPPFQGNWPYFVTEFKWAAALKGGPQDGTRLAWKEELVARTPRGPFVVWKRDQPAGTWNTHAAPNAPLQTGAWRNDAVEAFEVRRQSSSQFNAGGGLNLANVQASSSWKETLWPVDTQSLDWKAEMVAFPGEGAQLWYAPAPQSVLDARAKTQGAATWKRTVALQFAPKKLNPVWLSGRDLLPNSPASKAQTSVMVFTRAGNWRSYRRLVARSKTTKRTLWDNASPNSDFMHLQKSVRGSNASFPIDRDGQGVSFDLTKVPASWGEIVFGCDTVFDVKGHAPVVAKYKEAASAEALARFEKQWDGYRISNRLVLRPPAKSDK